jgi:predicted outer membrane lipoprotein
VSWILGIVLAGLVPVAAGDAAARSGGGPALVVVALPAQASPAILEALNRLRGEASSVGFEVRLVSSAEGALSLEQIERLWADLQPAAVVAFARRDDGAQTPPALDVTFLDRTSGRTSVAHLTAGEVTDAPERAEVIMAVRAVDFIRARMFDTLAGRRGEPPPPPPPPSAVAPPRRYAVTAGLAVLHAPSGFTVGLAPRMAVGYRAARWLRVAVTAFGLGQMAQREVEAGRVNLAQGFVGANAAWLGPAWHRLQPVFELGGGEYWVTTRGEAIAPNLGATTTLSSPGATTSLGVAFGILPWLALELRGSTLWLKSQVHINSMADVNLGTVGRPLWFGDVSLAASF